MTFQHSVALPASNSATLVSQPVVGRLDSGAAADIPQRVGDWVLRPRHEWPDEFSPRYSNGRGCFLDGDPTDPDGNGAAELFTYVSRNAETGECCEVEAIQNEAVVNFAPCVTAEAIRRLFHELGLEILQAWFDPQPCRPESSMSWFLVGVGPDSRFHRDVEGLVERLTALPCVVSAGYSSVAHAAAKPLYPRTGPDDELFRIYETHYWGEIRNLALAPLGLVGLPSAWYDEGADLGNATQKTCVVIMDSGVDVDHPEFGGPGDPGSIYSLTRSGVERRQGLSSEKKHRDFGDVGAFEAEPQQSIVGEPVRAAGAPLGSAPDPLEFIDLQHEDHGHGTVMAGIIGARTNNKKLIASLGLDSVKIMSARLRMVGNGRYSVASAVPLVRLLTERHSDPAVRVVYMGFSVDMAERDGDMQDLFKAMKKDREAGNDRVWVAPAGNRNGYALSYPAAILKKRRGKTTDEPLESLPAVIGVTGSSVYVEPWGFRGDTSTNFNGRQRKDGGFDPLDRDIFGVSALTFWGDSLDVRDRWYGKHYSLAPARLAPGGRAGYYGIDMSGIKPKPLPRATAADNPYRQGGLFAGLHVTAYGGRTPPKLIREDVDGYGRLLERAVTVPPPPVLGNSFAAAQIAALAAMLFAKYGNARTGYQVVEAIRRSVRGSPHSASGLGPPTVDEVQAPGPGGGITTVRYPVIEWFNQARKEVVRIPGLVDFVAALTVNFNDIPRTRRG